MSVHIDATWRIRLNNLKMAAIRAAATITVAACLVAFLFGFTACWVRFGECED